MDNRYAGGGYGQALPLGQATDVTPIPAPQPEPSENEPSKEQK
jgi:hypothetical protein